MYFSLATITAVVPLLASASPLARQPHTTIPLSRRSNLYEPDSIVDLDKANEHHASIMAKMTRGFENYERNTGKRHPLQPDVVPGVKRGVGDVPLDYVYYVDEPFWSGDILVGTPPKKFTVQYDTNSADLVLPHSSCGSECDGHARYDPSVSSTSALGKEYDYHKVAYGILYNDTVTIAGLTAVNQTFGAIVYKENFNRASFPADGIMGMGFGQTSNFDMPTVFDNLVSQGQTTKGVFALKLTTPGGELNIGELNPALYTGTPTYTSFRGEGFWRTTINAVKVGKTNVLERPTEAILDSGSGFTHGPIEDVEKFYAQIPGSKVVSPSQGVRPQRIYHFTVPCSTRNPPDVSFTIGRKDLLMSPSSLLAGKHESGDCLGSIVGNEWQGAWILGERWMSNFYTIFDYDKGRVGFADLK